LLCRVCQIYGRVKNYLHGSDLLGLPSEGDGHYSSTVFCNLQESRLCQIKMLEWRIAPSSIVIGLRQIGRAKVCSGDGDGAGPAPSGVIVASHFIARTTAQAIVEQGCA
jgi:hypothetical protein